MIARLLSFALLSVTLAVSAEESAISDVEVWNQGVEYYRSGDVTNALRVLRPLTLSRTHGSRAAEIVAKLAYDRKDYEEASRMAQIALRANPNDDRANRNFTRAADRLPELREQRRIEAIMKAAEGKDPGSLLQVAAHDARQLMSEAGTYRTNAAPAAVAMADRLAASAQRLADVWLPVRETIARSVTNEAQAATIVQQLDAAEAKSRQAARRLGDLNPEAYSSLSEVEHDLTRFLKLTIMPPAAMAEDLVAQSNAWQDVAAFNDREWQRDALDFTRAFRARFPAWARSYEQQAQSDTNRPPFTAEDQAKISALATELEKLQLECCEKSLPPNQQKALTLIRKIQELLPKDNQQGGGQSGAPQSNDSSKDKDKSQSDPQPQEPQPNQEPQESDQQQEANPQQQPEPSAGEQPEPQQPEDRELDAVLKKAQERNDEHEAEKKARMRKSALPPNEKDW